MLDTIVIFGATGDLACRYLLPSLVKLEEAKRLPEKFQIIGVSKQDWDTSKLREFLASEMGKKANLSLNGAQAALLSRTEYRRCDASRSEEVSTLLDSIKSAFVVYCALPPALLEPVAEGFAKVRPQDGSRIVFEKPFGRDLASAQRLNQLMHGAIPESRIFRIDHFLHKQTVQNILGLRFANRVFECVWNCHHVERVEIAWEETLTFEGRVSYYDSTGALCDMIQNHLLQLLCLVAMEPPHSLEERSLRDRKVDVLRAVRKWSAHELERKSLRARYREGHIGGRPIPAYVNEKGVDPKRQTETFAQVELVVDNWRWAGVPFILRSGKALVEERKEIAIYFKPVPHLAFGQRQAPVPNVLRLSAVPDRMGLRININGPGNPFELERLELDASLAPQELSAYSRLLLDVIEGDPSLSIRGDEAEESWRIIEPIMNAWKAERVQLVEYPAGSAGPALIPAGRRHS